MAISVDNAEIAWLEDLIFRLRIQLLEHQGDLTSILNCDIKEDEMAEFHRMDRHNPTFPQVASPVLVGILVIDAIFQVVGEKVLEF
jgi:hypothetical protein